MTVTACSALKFYSDTLRLKMWSRSFDGWATMLHCNVGGHDE